MLKYIQANPGALQNKLGNALNASGKDTSRIIRTMENVGIVTRKPSNKTYELYLKRRADNNP